MNLFPSINVVTRWGIVAMVTARIADQSGYAQTASRADDDSLPLVAELLNRVADLELEMASMRAEQSDDWLTNQRADEIRGLITHVLADADKRTALFDQKVTAGYDDHFFLASTDGKFRLEISGQVQLRLVYNHLDDSEDSDRLGFENRRTKLKLSGHVINPRLRFSITGAFDDEDGGFALNGAYAAYAVTDEFSVRAGRFRSPLLREEDISSKRQLLAERSLVARAFKQVRTNGVALQYQQQAFRFRGAFMDATAKRFGDPSFIVSGRGEMLLSGEWHQLSDFTSFRSDEPTIALGVGALYQEVDFDDSKDNDTQLLRWTADVSMEFGGGNLFAAIVGNNVDEQEQDSLDQLGVVLQGGLFLTDDIELFSQYVWGDADGEASDLSVLTVGFNYYLAEHALKWTMDLGYAFNEVGGVWATKSAGYRKNDGGDDGQIVVRAQWQLLF